MVSLAAAPGFARLVGEAASLPSSRWRSGGGVPPKGVSSIDPTVSSSFRYDARLFTSSLRSSWLSSSLLPL